MTLNLFFSLKKAAVIVVYSMVGYTPPDGHYSIDVNETSLYRRVELEGGYTDVYTVPSTIDGEEFEYLLMVTRLDEEEDISFEIIDSPVFKENYLRTCNCAIKSDSVADFPNYKAIIYYITIREGDRDFIGKSVHLIKDNTVFSLNYLAEEENYSTYEREFEQSLLSFK